ncbi:TPA: MurR/RpiR family transcriptional regulator [Clostridium botulinum]|uniref:MurR/RpiR family transcriptional regulator n=1 Tax=Clostridium botulinum TaxID=1491 RepID=UPI0029AD1F49|nr:MurR/RpiR family transcriptional regulator [Clostridium botulinum]HDK7177841.1 MurR/RpiR family transcriptional regulator [Clostridium botulinum]HDK7189588.1 MurR/RpiR family transcriptional regulator [Clostridium botulinum]HDK7217194.1 MurR/RpiR family transcriptional regulator [Clostridium botulinum]HDK7223973.1 MurR/RpiR family transcriptional regulator [Clostridium botulinum]
MLYCIDNSILNTLTQSELSVLQYIDVHSNEVLTMSIQELSEKVFFSTATILRLCKKLNLSGFSELKFTLKNNVSFNNSLKSTAISTKKIVTDLYSEIENTGRLLDTKTLDTIVGYLLSNKKIHLFSYGLTNMAFEYMQRYLLATGRQTILYKTDTLAYKAVNNLTENDVLFLSSSTGSNPSTLKLAKIAKNSNTIIVAITPFTNNPLSKIADINLYTFIKERDFFDSDIKNRTCIFYIVDMIIECYIKYLDKSKFNNLY